ncbi:cell division protein FtsW [Candidatus Shapirobacteria bacterium]|nr:cell division protein FtsW [Candidatus Shapirobacteria bacterium]
MASEKKGNSFFIIALLFLLFGLLLIGDVSLIEAERNFGDQFYFLKKQITWALLGAVVFALAAKINYRFWQKISLPLLIVSWFALGLVLIPRFGQVIGGSRRWLNLGGYVFQPSELAKFSLVLYLSALLSRKKINFRQFLLVLFLPVGLTILEPDFGTSVIMVAASLVLWFLSGAVLRKIILPSLFFLGLGLLLICISPYRKARVRGMIDPFYDPLDKSYHSYQLVLTLGSGGAGGIGLGQSRQKYQYLPHVTTDSIMAVVGEEFGLIGISSVIGAFLYLIFSGFKIGINSQDDFARLFTGGIVTWIAVQGLINLSAVAIVLPLTGVPFPLVSYGGSSLVLTLFSLGIIYNIWSKQ